MANLIPVRKKSGDIRICIDFRNLNRASLKDNYPVPSMEQLLQSVSRSAMLSLLDGFSGYNQVLVSKEDRLKQHFKPNGAPMLMIRCLSDSLMLEPHSSEPWILHLEAYSTSP